MKCVLFLFEIIKAWKLCICLWISTQHMEYICSSNFSSVTHFGSKYRLLDLKLYISLFSFCFCLFSYRPLNFANILHPSWRLSFFLTALFKLIMYNNLHTAGIVKILLHLCNRREVEYSPWSIQVSGGGFQSFSGWENIL